MMMGRQAMVLTMVLGLVAWRSLGAAEHESLWDLDRLTGDSWPLADRLSDRGLQLSLSLTDIEQAKLEGGIPGSRRASRNTGSTDLELSADLQKLAGLHGTTLYGLMESSWGREGVDETAVGSFFGVNYDSAGNHNGDVTELWIEQALFDGSVRVRVGKLDVRGGFECRGCPVSFDSSSFANDETTQFLNGALRNNPAIPFPWMGLGAILHWKPMEWGYASAGVMDADADLHKSGFTTAFNGDPNYFYVFETGVAPRLASASGPLQGAYRFGVWYDPRPKAYAGATEAYGNDAGVYFSGDQVVARESGDPNDAQGLGVFLRCGWADSRHNDVVAFWSAGLQYRGLIQGRDDDVVAVGFAHGTFSNLASSTFTADHEAVVETYYNAKVAGWLNLSPSLQVVVHPGGQRDADPAVVAGVRLEMVF
jgi:porin